MKAKPDLLGLNPIFRLLTQRVSWATLIAIAAIMGIILAIFVAAGGVDVSADKPDGWLSRTLLHFVFKRSEGLRSGEVVQPIDFNSPWRVRLAAQHFDMVCANCHGRPGFGQSMVALSMSPRPQYLPKVVGQFTNAELYEIVEHGVKYSAMPSWPTDARGDEVWSMVAFLRQLPKMDGQAYRALTAPPAQSKAAPLVVGYGAALRPANARQDAPPADEFLYAAPSAGFADEGIHETPTPTCARCHGADGSGAVTGGEAPNLTVHDAAYLQAALEAYTRGGRKSGFMQNIASQLSEPQIAALSHYYADLPVRTITPPAADAALAKRGEIIASQGVPEHAIPACSNCHESGGAAITRAPHIAGQSAIYLRRQLAVMSRGGRGSSVAWNPMPAVAHDLGKNDIAAVAAYYSGLQPMKASGESQVTRAPQASPPSSREMAEAKAIFDTHCSTCHLQDGRGDLQGEFPNLTLQTRPYVAQSLYAFRNRTRPSVKMSQSANSVTFAQMANLALYIDGLPPQRALAKPDMAAAARGAVIATNGAPARGVPACLSCHGAKGVAALPLIPRLQGQNVIYLRNKLNSFAKPYAAKLSALNPMPSIASPLTDQERADLAAYFAAAAPIEKTAVR